MGCGKVGRIGARRNCAKTEQMPLTYGQRRHKVVWLGARDGRYVVKKRIPVCQSKRRKANKRASPSNTLLKEVWGQVWKMKVLPKMIHFVWRCLVGTVPVREFLFKKRCSTSNICPVCEIESETTEHLFFVFFVFFYLGHGVYGLEAGWPSIRRERYE